MTYGSLFTGIGGFDLGLDRAGLSCAWQVEIDPQCNRVLEREWPGALRLSDIREAKGLPRVDVLCGGFPCQDLSVAGRRAGLDGARSGLFYEMARVADELRPAAIVWENVPGLYSAVAGGSRVPGSAFVAVLSELARIGYSGAWSVLDAQYFGLAQRRERIFGVFFAGDSGGGPAAQVLALASRLRGNPPPRRAAGQDVAGTPGGIAPGRGGRASVDGGPGGFDPVASALRAGGDGAGLFVPALADPIITNEGSTYTHEGTTFRTRNVVGALHSASGRPSTTTEDAGQLVPTVTSKWAKGSGGPSGSETGNLTAVGGVRRYTPRECERLQGFSDDWTATGAEGKRISDGARYRMLGNAVAVPVARWVAGRLAAQLRAQGVE